TADLVVRRPAGYAGACSDALKFQRRINCGGRLTLSLRAIAQLSRSVAAPAVGASTTQPARVLLASRDRLPVGRYADANRRALRRSGARAQLAESPVAPTVELSVP